MQSQDYRYEKIGLVLGILALGFTLLVLMV